MTADESLARADMAPPESAVEGFGYGDPMRDIDRSNYVRKTDEYVRRAEAYKLQPRVPDFDKLRCVLFPCSKFHN